MTEPPHSNNNRLIHETSPYLRQHAHNPVDWYPWGEEALDRARREGKPILLSIGYSACHWCHVMAHESFEDEATARAMNELFVNIKVDREERPDLDKIYQTAFQMLHRRAGGWPLTMFLTHDDHVPFVGGTYFPKTPRYGMPAFTEILSRVSAHYRQHQPELRQQNQALLEALRAEIATPAAGEPAALDDAPLRAARDALIHGFDPVNGGFGGAPKFPHPTSLERLLRCWAASVRGDAPDRQAETVVLSTLRKMALGGIYDHLGGGFYRYSVDAEWQIPHFEKMLYDNGPLLALYAQAWRATQTPLFRVVAEETGAWLMREMQDPAGGYYATLDADSEGEEGKFHLWTPDQVRDLLSTEEYVAFAVCYGLEQPPNFENQSWHLRLAVEIPELASRLGVAPAQVGEWLAAARRKLFEARSQRIWPGRDEKILTAWNGLTMRGMAIAGRHLGRADFVASAERALDFIRARLWRDGRLLAVHKDGQARLNAYLDDYAFLIDGILELLQCRWRDGDLDFALALADVLLEQFEDRGAGGFFFTATDHEALIQRPKSAHDDALPAGNGIAAQVLSKLGHLTGQTHYLEAAERTLRWAWPMLEQLPNACNAVLAALEDLLAPAQTIVLRGQPEALAEWWERCARPYAPNRLTLAIPATAAVPAGLLAERRAGAAPAIAYICAGLECRSPLATLDALERELAQ
ncbi:MAG: thioredoxin domain-containing protein [Candidatus Competibacter sp.]|nr:thioredoxin domain-containing protein [Candidatus Competibacter sp.]MDG4584277.1 thioredoxin domain-containing protein [Candidatus Competibacter sp.]